MFLLFNLFVSNACKNVLNDSAGMKCKEKEKEIYEMITFRHNVNIINTYISINTYIYI